MERNRWIYDLIWCADCGAHVPVFRDLAPLEQRLVDAWKAKSVHYPQVARETGLTEGLAKAWVLHRSKPINTKGPWNSTPCPECKRWLRGLNAKQCFHCGAD